MCGEQFRSKEKFKKLCPEHNRDLNEEQILQVKEKVEDKLADESLDRFLEKIY